MFDTGHKEEEESDVLLWFNRPATENESERNREKEEKRASPLILIM